MGILLPILQASVGTWTVDSRWTVVFFGKVRLSRVLQILFGQKMVDETWYGMCVCSCVHAVWEKTAWPVGLIQCLLCSSALGSSSRSVRVFLLDHSQAPFPSHPLICLSLDANMCELKLTQGHHHKLDTQGTENGRRNLTGRGLGVA